MITLWYSGRPVHTGFQICSALPARIVRRRYVIRKNSWLSMISGMYYKLFSAGKDKIPDLMFQFMASCLKFCQRPPVWTGGKLALPCQVYKLLVSGKYFQDVFRVILPVSCDKDTGV